MRSVIDHGDSGEQLIGELFGMPERFEPARGEAQPSSLQWVDRERNPAAARR